MEQQEGPHADQSVAPDAAAPQNQPPQQQQQQQQHGDTRLAFSSPDFDAALALQTPDLRVPVPDAPVLDNVSKCAALLPAAEPGADGQAAAPAPQHQPTTEAKKAKAAALKQRAQQAAQRAAASVKVASLASIMAAAAAASGPLAVLARWQQQGQRVYVVTRHASGVRGRAVGTLVGFDRFLNLLLRDVAEHYTVIVKVRRTKQQQQEQLEQQQQEQLEQQQQSPDQQQQPADQQQQQPKPAGPADRARTRTRWCRKQEHRFRQLDQVLVKGDNVVLVSGTPPHSAAHAAAAAAAAAAGPGRCPPGVEAAAAAAAGVPGGGSGSSVAL